MDIIRMTALEISEKIRQGQLKVCQVLDAFFSRSKAVEKDINAFITLCGKSAYEEGERVQKLIDEGKLSGPLAGVPIAVKDNICTKGIRTTCASKILENFIPGYDASVIEQIRAAGMIVIGKTNMDEFAMGSTTETSYFGITANPADLSRVPGGSSGGSCAAVAACEAPIALGSDTGGSVRQPASYCGVTGIKPTYGGVSRYGLVAYASSLDQIGPVAKDVRDAAALLSVISARDKKDSTSTGLGGKDLLSGLNGNIRGMRIGIPNEYFAKGIDTEIAESIMALAAKLEKAGAMVEKFDLGMLEYAVPTYYIIASAEASSNLARFDGVKYGFRAGEHTGLHEMYKRTRSEGFGSEVKRRIMLGSFVLSSGYYDEYYLKALKAKALIKRAFDKAFERYDIILAPNAPATAPKTGESLNDPIKMYLSDIYTVSVNLAGLPAASIPCAVSGAGLPIGAQLIAGCYNEQILLNAALACEMIGKGGHDGCI